jgi:hypothetical protein
MTMLKIKTYTVALLVFIGVLLFSVMQTVVAQVSPPNRSLKISDPRAGQANVRYTIGFGVSNPGYVLGSFTLLFCDNSPLIGQPCTAPTGLDVSSAVLTSQTGVTGFSIVPGATANSLVFTRTAAFVSTTYITIEISGITNPSAVGTYFGRIQTYSSEDATGVSVNEGGVTFSINVPIDVQTVVPPYLYMCVGVTIPGYLCTGAINSFIDLGELSTRQARTATSEFIVATNAGDGFVVYVTGTPPTSGNNVIPAMSSRQPSRPGTSQFGINLRDNSNPDVGVEPLGIGSGVIRPDYDVTNQFKYANGDNIVFSNTTTADKKFTVSYVINVDENQRPGIYNTTLLYTALAQF